QQQVRHGAVRVCEGIAAAHGVEVDAQFAELYPVTCNDAEETALVGDALRELHGQRRFLPARDPLTGSEDFSRVLAEVPGAMLALGACGPEADYSATPNNHSPQAFFDDAVLGDGAAAYAALALHRQQH